MIKVLLNLFWVADLDLDVFRLSQLKSVDPLWQQGRESLVSVRRLHNRRECKQYVRFKRSPENEQNKGRT